MKKTTHGRLADDRGRLAERNVAHMSSRMIFAL